MVCYCIPSDASPSIRTSFPDNSSYTFHWIVLKLGGQLEHVAVQRILFRGYISLNDIFITLLKDFFSDLTSFLDNSSNSFHPIELKHGGQLDCNVVQRIFISRLHYTKVYLIE